MNVYDSSPVLPSPSPRPLSPGAVQMSAFTQSHSHPPSSSPPPPPSSSSLPSLSPPLARSLRVSHSWFLYLFPFSLCTTLFSLFASLSLDLSDTSVCDARVTSFLFCFIAHSYSLLFFLSFLLLFGRQRTRTFQRSFFLLYVSCAFALLVWGSVSLFSVAAVNISTPPSFSLTNSAPTYSFTSSPCTDSLPFRAALAALVLCFIFFLLLLLCGLYSCMAHCCCGSEWDRSGVIVLGMGGLKRRREEFEAEARAQKALGMALAKGVELEEEEGEGQNAGGRKQEGGGHAGGEVMEIGPLYDIDRREEHAEGAQYDRFAL